MVIIFSVKFINLSLIKIRHLNNNFLFLKNVDDTSYGTVTTPQALTVTETPRVLQHTTETGNLRGNT